MKTDLSAPRFSRIDGTGQYLAAMRYRFLTRPSWLASIAGLLLLAVLFVRLGWWQFDRAHRHQSVSAAVAAQRTDPVPLAGLLTGGLPASDSAIGRAVVATGEIDGARQLLVPDRRLGTQTGFYVIAPLKLADGSVIVVNRGWTAGTTIPAAPSGPVTVTGWLGYAETADSASLAAVRSAAQDPAHRIASIDVSSLVNDWPYPLDRAYVTELGPTRADASGLRPVPAPAPRSGKTSWNILNLGYFAQWWLFAVVALWWFASYVRRLALGPDEDADEEEEAAAAAETAAAPTSVAAQAAQAATTGELETTPRSQAPASSGSASAAE